MATLEQADISVDGLFLNADVVFYSKKLGNPVVKKKFMAIFVSISVMEKQTEMSILTKIYIMNAMQ